MAVLLRLIFIITFVEEPLHRVGCKDHLVNQQGHHHVVVGHNDNIMTMNQQRDYGVNRPTLHHRIGVTLMDLVAM